MGKVKLFVHPNCVPCQEVKDLVIEGQLEDQVEIIDVTNDDGFKQFKDQVLCHGDGAVPSAYKDGRSCQIMTGGEKGLEIICPPSSPEIESVPPA